MNLLIYSYDPYQSALWIDDKRKNKFILESAQMMSTAIRMNSEVCNDPVYQLSYVNHPCSKWVRLSRKNFQWCLDHWLAMLEQRGRRHKCQQLQPYFEQYSKEGYFPYEYLTEFANCARNKSLGLDYTSLPIIDAYRQYSVQRWLSDDVSPTWYDGKQPEWRFS